MTSNPGTAPSWLLTAVEAPSRFAEIAAVRARIISEPFRVLRHLVPEIESHAAKIGEDDAWKANVFRLMFMTWLEHEPDATKRTKSASKAQADRAAAVAKAAEALLNAIASARAGLTACRLEGIEPVLLPQGLDELDLVEAEPTVASLLDVARRRSTSNGRKSGYASVATLIAKLDAATAPLGIHLSEDATADFCELADLSAKRTFTVDAIRKSRARTLR